MKNPARDHHPANRLFAAIIRPLLSAASCMALFIATAAADTVVYWRFEEGVAGTQPQHMAADPTAGPYPVLDSSGNGYHLGTWDTNTAPTYHDDVPFSAVLGAEALNSLSLEFASNDDIFTSATAGLGLESMTLDTWTLEASFCVDNVTQHHGLVGKDGKPDPFSPLAPLQLKVRDDDASVQIEILDGSGTEREVRSTAAILPERWYHVAAVSDGSTLELFLDQLDGNGYVSQGSIDVTGGALIDSTGTWTVGRGFFNGMIGDWTAGRIDEVRLSDTALAPGTFLFSPEETLQWDQSGDGMWSSPHWTGAGAGAEPSAANGVVIRNDTVTISSFAEAYRVEAESGDIVINPGRVLNIATVADFGAGATLSLHEGAILAAGGGGDVAHLSVAGDARLIIGRDMRIAALNVAAATELTKTGIGTLVLNNGSGSVSAVGGSLRIAEGTVEASGDDPLGGMSTVSLAGGRLSLFAPTSRADTAAYWRFEEGSADMQTDVYQGDWFVDSSGNGNDLWTWADFTAPTYRADTASDIIPQTGAANGLSLEFHPSQDLYTNNKPINDLAFEELTVEASVKLNSLDQWQVVVGKDGTPTGGDVPPFYLKYNDAEDEFEFFLVDGGGTVRSVLTDINPAVDKWYHLAATSDGSTMRFFVKSPGDTEYVQQGADLAVDGALIASSGSWSIGRGMWDGRITDWTDGTIDEVRISQSALAPGEFLQDVAGIGGSLDMSDTDVLVAADSMLHVVADSPTDFGTLKLQGGVITTSGKGGVAMSRTELTSPGTTVGIDVQTPTQLGPLLRARPEPLSVVKRGPIDLVLSDPATGLDKTTFDVQEGCLVGIATRNANPFGGADVRLDGGDLALATAGLGSRVTFDGALTVTNSASLRVGPADARETRPFTVELGAPTNAIALDATLAVDVAAQHTLNLLGDLMGDGTLSIDTGHVILSGTTNSVSQVTLAAGTTLDTADNDLTVTDVLMLNTTQLAIDQGNAFSIRGSDLLAGSELTLSGGTLTASLPGALADTVAYWRFEEGTLTAETKTYQEETYLDSSGRGNHLRALGADQSPLYVDEIPFDTVPQTGAANRLAIGLAPHDGGGNDLYTVDKPINDLIFEELTVEASVQLASLDKWQVLVGKDGQPTDGAESPFALKFNDAEDEFEVHFLDGRGETHTIISDVDPVLGQWYDLAVTSDGATARLFVRSPSDNDYVQQGPGIALGGGGALIESDGSWTIGRGMWDGNLADWTDGLIDEVRISSRARSPDEFLGAIGTSEAMTLELANTDIRVTEDSTFHLIADIDTTLGSLTLADDVRFALRGPGANFRRVKTDRDATIEGTVMVRELLSAGNGVGSLTVIGDLELIEGDQGTPGVQYEVDLGGPRGDLVEVTGAVFLAGTLNVEGVGRLDSVGPQSHTIVAAIGGEEIIVDEFTTVPEVGEHLGHGIFYQDVTYNQTEVQVDVFQAEYGDLNGDRQVNILDIFTVKSSPRGFGSGATDATWLDGDMVGSGLGTPPDGIVNLFDIFAIKLAGQFGQGPYAAHGEPGSADMGGDMQAVAEPSTFTILLVGLAAWGLIWCQRKR